MMVSNVAPEGRSYGHVENPNHRGTRKEAVCTVLRLCWYFCGQSVSEREKKGGGFLGCHACTVLHYSVYKTVFHVTVGSLAFDSFNASLAKQGAK